MCVFLYLYCHYRYVVTKLKHSDYQHPAEYFDHLLNIHEHFQHPVCQVAASSHSGLSYLCFLLCPIGGGELDGVSTGPRVLLWWRYGIPCGLVAWG